MITWLQKVNAFKGYDYHFKINNTSSDNWWLNVLLLLFHKHSLYALLLYGKAVSQWPIYIFIKLHCEEKKWKELLNKEADENLSHPMPI